MISYCFYILFSPTTSIVTYLFVISFYLQRKIKAPSPLPQDEDSRQSGHADMETIESDSDLDVPPAQKTKKAMISLPSVSSSTSSSSSSLESSSEEISSSESSDSSNESSDEEACFEDAVCIISEDLKR